MYLFELWFSPGICPGVGFLGHMIVLYLVFKEPPYYSLAAPAYIPTNGGLLGLFFGEMSLAPFSTQFCAFKKKIVHYFKVI